MGAPNPRVQCYATPRDVTRNGTNQAYSRPIIRTSDQKSVATRRPARGHCRTRRSGHPLARRRANPRSAPSASPRGVRAQPRASAHRFKIKAGCPIGCPSSLEGCQLWLSALVIMGNSEIGMTWDESR